MLITVYFSLAKLVKKDNNAKQSLIFLCHQWPDNREASYTEKNNAMQRA